MKRVKAATPKDAAPKQPKLAAKEDKMAPKLTAKEDKLVEMFLIYRCKAKAYLEAGYNPGGMRSYCYKVFGRPHVQAAIAERLKQNHMDTDFALAVLSDMAAGNMDFFVEVTPGGVPVVNVNEAKKLNKMNLIKAIRPTKWGTAVELQDPVRAIEAYAKIAKWVGPEQGDGGASGASNQNAMQELLDSKKGK